MGMGGEDESGCNQSCCQFVDDLRCAGVVISPQDVVDCPGCTPLNVLMLSRLSFSKAAVPYSG